MNSANERPPSIFAVIITWNQRDETLDCLASLRRATYANLRLIVVDNGSNDETAGAIRTQYPDAEILRNATNRGFAAAVNQGTRHALTQGAEFVLWLNNDTVVEPGALAALLAEAGRTRAGILIPLITYFDQPKVVWSAGAGINPLTLEIRANTLGAIDRGQWRDVIDRQHATACASLIPRATLEKVGLLDERFFYYYDDADYSLRVIRAGLRILLVPQARVLHKVARASGGVDTPYHRYWMGRSSVIYFRKHVHGWRWAVVAPYRLASAARTTARLVLERKRASAAAYLRGLRDGLRTDLSSPSASDFSA
jgi:GT2 family glycosyltransferase